MAAPSFWGRGANFFTPLRPFRPFRLRSISMAQTFYGGIMDLASLLHITQLLALYGRVSRVHAKFRDRCTRAGRASCPDLSRSLIVPVCTCQRNTETQRWIGTTSIVCFPVLSFVLRPERICRMESGSASRIRMFHLGQFNPQSSLSFAPLLPFSRLTDIFITWRPIKGVRPSDERTY